MSAFTAIADWPLDAAADPHLPVYAWPKRLRERVLTGQVCIVTGLKGAGKSALSLDLAGTLAPLALRASFEEELRRNAEALAPDAVHGIDQATARLKVRERLLLMALTILGGDGMTPSHLRQGIAKALRSTVKSLGGRGSEWGLSVSPGEMFASILGEIKLIWRPATEGEPTLEGRVAALERLLEEARAETVGVDGAGRPARRVVWCVIDGLSAASNEGSILALTSALEAVHQFFVDFARLAIVPLAFVDHRPYVRLAPDIRAALDPARTTLEWDDATLKAAMDAAIVSRSIGGALHRFGWRTEVLPGSLTQAAVMLGRGRPRDAVAFLKMYSEARLGSATVSDDAIVRAYAHHIVEQAENVWHEQWPPLRDCLAAITQVESPDALSRLAVGSRLPGAEATRSLLIDLYRTGLLTIVDRAGERHDHSAAPNYMPDMACRLFVRAPVSILFDLPVCSPWIDAVDTVVDSEDADTERPSVAPLKAPKLDLSIDVRPADERAAIGAGAPRLANLSEHHLPAEASSPGARRAPRLVLSDAGPTGTGPSSKPTTSSVGEAPASKPPRLILPKTP